MSAGSSAASHGGRSRLTERSPEHRATPARRGRSPGPFDSRMPGESRGSGSWAAAAASSCRTGRESSNAASCSAKGFDSSGIASTWNSTVFVSGPDGPAAAGNRAGSPISFCRENPSVPQPGSRSRPPAGSYPGRFRYRPGLGCLTLGSPGLPGEIVMGFFRAKIRVVPSFLGIASVLYSGRRSACPICGAQERR